MAKKNLKCYLYTRVSTEIQIDGYSLEAQKNRLRREAAHRGMKVVGEYSDEGKSGKNITGRPEFQQMLKDIKAGKDDVDYVLVFKLSRFGRNAADTLSSLQYMEDYGVNLLCVEDGIDSAGAAGKLMISVLAAVAEIERENIREQTMEGRKQKARDGRWNGGFAPYGYKLVAKDGERAKVLVIDESEAPLIRLIYDKFIHTNMGANGLAKWLNENGYTKKIRQNGTIKTISATFVKGVIDNPVYAGKIAYGRRKTEKIEGTRNEFHVVKQDRDSYKLYQGIHEPIVSEDDWYKAQVKRLKNAYKREKTHSLEHAHVLSGLLRCPECGAPMYGVVNRKKKPGSDEYYKDMWYYHCKNRRIVTGHKCSFRKNIRQEVLNNEVFAFVRYVFGGENSLKDKVMRKAGSDESLNELLADKERLEKEREKLESQKEKQLRRINALDIDDEFYDDLMTTYREGLRDINDRISLMDTNLYKTNLAIENAQGESVSLEIFKHMVDLLLSEFEMLSDADAKAMMNAFIEKIELFPEKQENGGWVKSVQFKVPLNVNGHEVDTLVRLADGEEDDTLIYMPEAGNRESEQKSDEESEGDSPSTISYPNDVTVETVALLSRKTEESKEDFPFTKEQIDEELKKGMDDIQEGRVYTAEQVEAEMKKDYGI